MLKYAHGEILVAELAGDASIRKAASQALGVPQQHIYKQAHRASFDHIPRREGYLYVRNRAISSRTNLNWDTWPAEEIATTEPGFGYLTFHGKPVFVEHANDNHRRTRGVNIAAALHEDHNPDGSPDTWVELLKEIDAKTFPKLSKALLAGRVNRTSMGCFVPGVPITMADGTSKPIESVEVGDNILTRSGDVEPVTYVMERPYKGLVYDIEVFGQASRCILTPDHPVWVRRAPLSRSQQLRRGLETFDPVVCSCGREFKSHRSLSAHIREAFRRGYEGTHQAPQEPDTFEWVKAESIRKGDWVLTPSLRHQPERLGNWDLARLLGYYLAEGNLCWDKNRSDAPIGVDWNFHENEIEYLDEIRGCLQRLGYVMVGPYSRDTNRGVTVRCNSPSFAQLILHLGGHRSWGKQVAPEVLSWSKDIQFALLTAYWNGDGHYERNRVEASTVSKNLADQLLLIAARCEVPLTPPVFQHSPSNKGHRPKYSMQAVLEPLTNLDGSIRRNLVEADSDGIWRQVTGVLVREYEGNVYNFDVDGDDSYVAANIAVHNCDVSHSICSKCGNVAYNVTQYCQHLPVLKGAKFERLDHKTGSKHLSYITEICKGLKFFEDTLIVTTPADPTAIIIGVEGNQHVTKTSRLVTARPRQNTATRRFYVPPRRYDDDSTEYWELERASRNALRSRYGDSQETKKAINANLRADMDERMERDPELRAWAEKRGQELNDENPGGLHLHWHQKVLGKPYPYLIAHNELSAKYNRDSENWYGPEEKQHRTAQIEDEWRKTTPAPHKVAMGTAIRHQIDQWAETSDSGDPDALALQHAAAVHWNMPDSLTKHFRSPASDEYPHRANERQWKEGIERYHQNKPFYHHFLDAVYQRTQQALADTPHLLLHRGHAFEDAERTPNWALPPVSKITTTKSSPYYRDWKGRWQRSGSDIHTVHFDEYPHDFRDLSFATQPLSSWSTNKDTAHTFSGGRYGQVVSIKVPREHIWSLASCSGPGCLDEQEAIVLGGYGHGHSVPNKLAYNRPHTYKTIQPEKFQPLMKKKAALEPPEEFYNIDDDDQHDWIKHPDGDVTPGGERIIPKKHQGSQKRAAKEITLPPRVDTLQVTVCPVCLSDNSFQSGRCSVCNSIEPPENLMAPDTDVAKQVQEYIDENTEDNSLLDEDDEQDDGEPDLICDNCGNTFTSADKDEEEGEPYQVEAEEEEPLGEEEEDEEAGEKGAEAEGEPPEEAEEDLQNEEEEDEEGLERTGYSEGDDCPVCGNGRLVPIDQADPDVLNGNNNEGEEEEDEQGDEGDGSFDSDADEDTDENEDEEEQVPGQSDESDPTVEVADDKGAPPEEDEYEDSDDDEDDDSSGSSDDEDSEDKKDKGDKKKLPFKKSHREGVGSTVAPTNRTQRNRGTSVNASGAERKALFEALNVQASRLEAADKALRSTIARVDNLLRERRDMANAFAKQAKFTRALAVRNETLERQMAYMAKAAGLSDPIVEIGKVGYQRVANLYRQANPANPAQPIMEPPPEAPIETEQQAMAPTSRGDVTQLGATPLTDVSSDASIAVDEPYGEAANVPVGMNRVDVTAPVDGTQYQRPPNETIVPVDVRVGNPNNPNPAFPWTMGPVGTPQQPTPPGPSVGNPPLPVQAAPGTRMANENNSNKRAFATLHLAKLQIAAGIASGDELEIAAALDASGVSDQSISDQIKTLAQVVEANKKAPPNVDPSPTRRLVPKAASLEPDVRSVPSLSSSNVRNPQAPNSPGFSPGEDEFGFI